MFETMSISACDRSGLGRCGPIIAVSALTFGAWFIPMAQADVNTQDTLGILSKAVSPPPGTIDFSQDVAVKQVLQRLVRKPDGSFDALFAKRLGFDIPVNLAETAVQQASTFFPIAVFRIGLKRLQQYEPTQHDPLTLLAADANWLVTLSPSFSQILVPSRFLFPITVPDPATGQKVVKSSMRMRVIFSPTNLTPTKLGFEIERFGSGTLIRQVDKWRRDPNPPHDINLKYFLVWVPALDRYYLGRLLDKDLRITAITDDRQVGLKEGEEKIAKEVFRKLKDEALTINADDPDAPPR